MHLFSAAKAEADLRGELARHMQVHGKLARKWAELEQWRSNFKDAVQRTRASPCHGTHGASKGFWPVSEAIRGARGRVVPRGPAASDAGHVGSEPRAAASASGAVGGAGAAA
jgi:hypothetical protein